MPGTLGQTAVSRLSGREREVAGLVAEGLTNKEVAQKLFLSERTVEGHVASICNKLGFHSRVQIAAWVTRQSGSALPGAPGQISIALQRDTLPPWWALALMAIGAPLPVAAAIFQWSQPAVLSVAAVPADLLVTVAAAAFIAVPGICLVGLATGRDWVRPVAVGGLLATGSLVLAVGSATLVVTELTGKAFRPADSFETVYAVATIPLLLVHGFAAWAVARSHLLAKWLVTIACLVWIARFGYGLSLCVLVLWLLWLQPEEARSP